MFGIAFQFISFHASYVLSNYLYQRQTGQFYRKIIPRSENNFNEKKNFCANF
nr:MAG TPA: hypothetical protein [Caudoviricetes sp.]